MTKAFYVVINATLGKSFCSLQGQPIMVLLVLFNTPLRCSLNVSQESSTKPRCFWDMAGYTLLKTNGGW